MDCQEARESILESMAEPLSPERQAALRIHIASCEDCRAFAGAQSALDASLAAAVPTAQLSPDFRKSLRRRIRRDPAAGWPDFLPDLAHLGGCAGAVVLLLFLLPGHSGVVLPAGAAFMGVTWV